MVSENASRIHEFDGVLVSGDTVPMLMLIIAAKIWVDLGAHLKEHS